MKFNHSYKNIFILLIAICLLQEFNSCSDKKDNKKVDFLVTATFGGLYARDTSQIVFVVGKLYNMSNDTLSFLSMACSWADSWKISSKNLLIDKELCYSNVPILIKLGPNESMLNYIPVKLLKPYNEIKNEKFLVGFNLVKTDTLIFANPIQMLEKGGNCFWSDTLQLNQINAFNTIKKEQ